MNNRQLGRPHRRPVQYHVLTLINPRVPLHPAPNQSSSFTHPTGQPLVNPPLKTQAAFVGKLYAMLEDKISRRRI